MAVRPLPSPARSASLSRSAAIDRLSAAGVPAAPCLGFDELFTDPDLAAARCFVEQDHPTLGPLRMAAPFIRFGATPVRLERSAPLLGADGAAVLADIGYPAERLAALVGAGVVGPS